MKRFKQYLFENSNIITTKKFVKSVENFIFTNDKKYLKMIEKEKNKIPLMFRKGQVLFRGMIFDEKEFDLLKNGKNIILKDSSSWTTDQNMAMRFITDPSKRIAKKKGMGVIFKNKISDSDVILNIQSYILFLDGMGILDEFEFDELNKEMGIKENETLVSGGIQLTNKNIIKTKTI